MDNRKQDKPVALEAYEKMAEEYNKRVPTKDYNAYLERPATLSLLPDIQGKHVLDAGCGPGIYAEILLDRGAKVTAIDVSTKMIQFAKQRLGNRATIRQANLEKPLDFLSDNSVDLVFSSLVLDYVKDWDSLFAEFARILRDDGYFIFSTEHPFSKFTYKDHPKCEVLPENYYEKEYVEFTWTGFGQPILVPSYRRPLAMFFECLHSVGFYLEKLVEPRPTEDFKRQNPESYEKASRNPTFLCIRARKTL
ncbi:MAG: class I SAM-dependent methyltransferase [Candidatus Hermodarchaeia archaeon]|jgi:SAM-dependent methyltransferase